MAGRLSYAEREEPLALDDMAPLCPVFHKQNIGSPTAGMTPTGLSLP